MFCFREIEQVSGTDTIKAILQNKNCFVFNSLHLCEYIKSFHLIIRNIELFSHWFIRQKCAMNVKVSMNFFFDLFGNIKYFIFHDQKISYEKKHTKLSGISTLFYIREFENFHNETYKIYESTKVIEPLENHEIITTPSQVSVFQRKLTFYLTTPPRLCILDLVENKSQELFHWFCLFFPTATLTQIHFQCH